MNILSKIQRYFNRTTVQNDTGERIETLRFTVPALRVGVLEYAVGQLTTNNAELSGKAVRLYYPPEAVSDEKFLKSLQAAPVVVGGHDSTTNEQNKKIDGWAHTVSYDATLKAAMISGIVKGNKEVAYIKSNLGQNDFGASAFVDMIVDPQNGTTPDGETYNAIAMDLRATHVALAPHVRDPENKIKVTNAVVLNTAGKYQSEDNMELTMEQIAAIAKNAAEEAIQEKAGDDRMDKLESAVNLIGANVKEIQEAMGGAAGDNCFGKGKNADEEKQKEEEKNEDGEKKEDVTLENAKPSQALVAAVGTALNVDFGSKTPSFATIANMLGIKETDAALRIAAVNAKFTELGKTQAVTKNTAETSSQEAF